MPTTPLFEPSPARQKESRLERFIEECGFDDYNSAWAWSVAEETAGEFWGRAADFCGVRWFSPADAPLVRDPSRATGAHWFPGSAVNYAEMALMRGPSASAVAIRALSDTRPSSELTWSELRSLVSRVRAGLAEAGVRPGDCVAGYLPNIPETLAVMLAAASLGAVWTCCAPEMGVAGSLDRLSQAAPVVLVTVDGYQYGRRSIDRRAEAMAIREGLPSVRRAVWLPYLSATTPSALAALGDWTLWDDFLGPEDSRLGFEPVAFEHPLYVLFSSGTTGKPKAIVHGHGGILLEHAKALALHFDVGPADTFFWYTTTGWMMWNFCISGLLVGATVVLFDGDPAGPTGDRLWEVMAATRTTVGGVGAGYLVAGMKAAAEPATAHDLSGLRTLGSTGSPLPPAAAEWVYSSVSPSVLLASFSGGTDVCTGFVGPSPLHPVWAGEISCRCLGARVEVFDEDGRSIVGSEGELVVTAPLPSMPVGILGDKDGSRYRATYFSRFAAGSAYPVWAHGDRATLTERGTLTITGRSDGTLNRGGVRMGTAEFYSVVEGLAEVADSLAVHIEDPAGGPGELMLFVVPASPAPDADLADLIRGAVRRDLSPRHVPDLVQTIAVVPRTLSGKKLEVPVKKILAGMAPADAVAIASVADPASLDPFVELGRKRTSAG